MKIAVTGGTGLVGGFVVDDLLRNNHDVRVLTRTLEGKQRFGELQHLVDWHIGDMNDSKSIDSLLLNVDAVVHAAFAHVPGRFRGGEGDDTVGFWRANFVGTLQLVERARQVGVSRFVMLSSRAVFDGLTFQTEEIGDQEPPRPTTHYGMIKAASEHLAELYNDITICSVRPTGVYGLTYPLSKTKWWKMLANHIGGSADFPVDSSGRTEVHGSDVAAAISLLLSANETRIRGKSFNCSDIVTSEQQILELTRRIVDEGANLSSKEFDSLEKPKNTMASSALISLGWRPGGFERLTATIEQIIELAQLRR